MICLDPAAVVKRAHAEPESPALRGWLDERAETGWAGSVLTEIESFRALARYAPDAVSRLPAVLDQIDLIGLDPPVRILAQIARPATARSPDAIHLGTPLHTRRTLTSFVTCDKRLPGAARRAGLRSTRLPNQRRLIAGPWLRPWLRACPNPPGVPGAGVQSGREPWAGMRRGR